MYKPSPAMSQTPPQSGVTRYSAIIFTLCFGRVSFFRQILHHREAPLRQFSFARGRVRHQDRGRDSRQRQETLPISGKVGFRRKIYPSTHVYLTYVYARSEYYTPLANMSFDYLFFIFIFILRRMGKNKFDKIFDLTASWSVLLFL